MTDGGVSERSKIAQRPARRWGQVVAIVGAVLVFGWWSLAGPGGGSELDRVASEHDLVLPASTSDVKAGGDASNFILESVGLDRGASSLIVIDRSELAAFLDQIPGLEQYPAPADNPAPGNRQYQHSSTPWDSSAEASYVSQTPPTGDFIELSVFPMDDSPDSERVGLWLYTDWN